ncbi:patatin-like phospholipase family protein [uncultured Paraglaciecola sp.]|uniref:patatin-like phospholipase family protein n=1 Tax=uncultured Paraglaciecola sp. TaxID=1765024 RepID=UPI0030D8A462|tara:strand:- start:24180 stop:25727 length:1548 start_codon:yes stop_codon:yes gene_type:complete
MSEFSHIPQGAAPVAKDGIRRSLIIPGGGLRLSYAAGVIKTLFAAGLTFQHMDGTSGGALNLAMLLSGVNIDDICARWASLDMQDTVAFLPIKQAINLKEFTASGSAEGFRTKVFSHLGIDVQKIKGAKGIQATFNVGNFSQKMNQVVEYQDISEDLLIAGLSLPGVLPPVTINGQVYLDAGFVQDANLMEAVKRGTNEIWLIWILANIPSYRTGLLNCYVQMLEMSANAALHKELAQIDEINQRIHQGEKIYGHEQPIRLHIIKPANPLPLDPDLYTGHVTHQQLIDLGTQDAEFYLTHKTQEGVPFEPHITVMTEARLGIQFKETMAGGFCLDVKEPKQGSSRGKHKGFELAMHAQVDIDDIQRFVEDPNHAGRLSGSIDFTPMGVGMVAHSGIFNLFYPDSQPDMKLMVYELGFNYNGQEFYLAGKKEVRDDPGFDLWSDTTTLFTQLHQGTDKNAPIVGAGILSLGIKDLLKLVSTVTVLNAQSNKDKVATVAKFGQFFMGELWDSYVKSS